MKASPQPQSRKNPAFTLIEVTVSIAILSIIVVVFSGVLQGVTAAWTSGQERMDNLTKARTILNRLQIDIQNFVSRDDLPNFGEDSGRSVLGFYTLQRGISSGGDNDRPLSYVEYRPELALTDQPPSLQRLSRPETYSGSSSPTFLPAPTPTIAVPASTPNPTPVPTPGDGLVTVRGLLAFAICFLHPDGKYSPSYYLDSVGRPSRATAVAVGMAVADDQTVNLLMNRGNLMTGLMNDLEIPLSVNTADFKDIWDYQLGLTENQPSGGAARLDFNHYGPTIVDGIRTFQRTFPLTPPR